jgi:hypothetical protein
MLLAAVFTPSGRSAQAAVSWPPVTEIRLLGRGWSFKVEMNGALSNGALFVAMLKPPTSVNSTTLQILQKMGCLSACCKDGGCTSIQPQTVSARM